MALEKSFRVFHLIRTDLLKCVDQDKSFIHSFVLLSHTHLLKHSSTFFRWYKFAAHLWYAAHLARQELR